jgi:hypothetical protein
LLKNLQEIWNSVTFEPHWHVGPPARPQVLPGFAYAIDSIVITVGSSITFDLMATLIDLIFQIDLSNSLFPVTRSLNQRAGWLSFVSICPTYSRFKNLFSAYLSVTQPCHPSKYRQYMEEQQIVSLNTRAKYNY